MSIGPSLPARLINTVQNQTGIDAGEDSDVYGPSLPPDFTLRVEKTCDVDETAVGGSCLLDAKVVCDEEDSDDDEFIGPQPSLAAPADARFSAADEFAERYRLREAEKKRIETEKNKTNVREEWMTSLPSSGLAQSIGVTARVFRREAAPQQDDTWTKTPLDICPQDASSSKGKKRIMDGDSSSDVDHHVADGLSVQCETSGQETLVQIHEKKMKKMKATVASDTQQKTLRVPFDRDKDLSVNKFDEAQRKSILKKAAQLNTRFGHGSKKYE